MKTILLLFGMVCVLLAPLRADQKVTIKSGDSIAMEVFDEAELKTSTKLLQSGEAVFPLIGSVKLGGLTIQEATEKVRELYAKDYLVDPKVTITISEYSVVYVDIMGAVIKPGRVPVPSIGKLDLSMALASAGGLSPTADPNAIEVIRADGSRRTFSESSIKSSGGMDLQAGDRIIVSESRFSGKMVTVRGQVKSPGSFRFPLDGKLDIVMAITRAGDLTDLANQKKITVTRGSKKFELDYREYMSDTNKRFYLEPGDLINVPERLF